MTENCSLHFLTLEIFAYGLNTTSAYLKCSFSVWVEIVEKWNDRICICFYYLGLKYREFSLIRSRLFHLIYHIFVSKDNISIFHSFLGLFFRHFTKVKDMIFAVKSLRECEGLC